MPEPDVTEFTMPIYFLRPYSHEALAEIGAAVNCINANEFRTCPPGTLKIFRVSPIDMQVPQVTVITSVDYMPEGWAAIVLDTATGETSRHDIYSSCEFSAEILGEVIVPEVLDAK